MTDSITNGFRISPYQKFLWSRKPSAGRALLIFEIAGDKEQALVAAVNDLCAACELLRTRLVCPRGMGLPLQVIDSVGSHWLESWDKLEPSEATEKLAESLDEESEVATLARIARLTDGRCLLALALAECNLDLSSALLIAEQLNGILAGGRPSISLQFADFAQWQQESFDALVEQQEDWRPHLEGRSPSLHGMARAAEYKPAVLELETTDILGQRLGNGASKLLAAWSILLGRLGDESQPCLGVYSSGRDVETLEGAIGPLGFHLPFKLRLISGESFAQHVARVETALAALHERHHDYFHERQEQRVLDWGFAWIGDNTQSPLQLHDLHLDHEHFRAELRALPIGERLCLRLRYDAASLSPSTAQRLGARLIQLLDHLLQDPNAAIDQAPLLLPDERQQLLLEFNRTALLDPRLAQNLSTLFAAQVSRTPNALAVTYVGQQLSYAELDHKANLWSQRLRTHGVQLESRVAICLPRSAEMMVAVWAVLKAGATYLPLEPDDPPERMAYILEHGEVRWLFTITRDREPRPEFPKGIELFDLSEEPEALAQPLPVASCFAETAAYMIYTSGSTGKPKGVVIQHGSAVNLALAMERLVYAGLEGPARITMNAPLSFDASMQQISMMTLGHHLHIVPRETRFDGAAFVQFLADHRIQMLDITPTHLGLLLQSGLLEAPNLALTRVSVAGGAIHPTMWDALAASSIRFFDIYGPTECTVNATGTPILEIGITPNIGQPLVNYQAYVVDRQLQPLPPGVPGQLGIAGVGLARGYAKRGGLTARHFVPNPFGTTAGSRLYLSGDLARHGCLGIEFLGRIDHQVKIRGYRVELGEIEQSLAVYPGIGRVHLTVKGRAEDGSDLKLLAYYESGAERINPVDLQNFLLRRLPYYIIPHVFIPLALLPLTANGKVDQNALPDQALNQDHVAPRDQLEAELVEIWAIALGTHEIGVLEDFFLLGGHSLSLMSTLNEINLHCGSALTIQDFFEQPTIAGLAQKIRDQESDLLASDEAAALLAELGDLTPEQIQAMLAEENP